MLTSAEHFTLSTCTLITGNAASTGQEGAKLVTAPCPWACFPNNSTLCGPACYSDNSIVAPVFSDHWHLLCYPGFNNLWSNGLDHHICSILGFLVALVWQNHLQHVASRMVSRLFLQLLQPVLCFSECFRPWPAVC